MFCTDIAPTEPIKGNYTVCGNCNTIMLLLEITNKRIVARELIDQELYEVRKIYEESKKTQL